MPDCFVMMMVVVTGLGAEGLHQRERLRAAVWEVATGQPDLGGRDLYRSRTTAGQLRARVSCMSSLWKKCLRSTLFSLPQIFGICLAQNLVSDIEAVQASWWENNLWLYRPQFSVLCILIQTEVFFYLRNTLPHLICTHLFLLFPFHNMRHFCSLS